ncbi:FeoB-associated Cys-rich membrane protein [Campylobacter sp. RM9344]|uniref:FeoB-associated Cys-rich membrane protein n=1 Tax=Campylobacter californiensis TaxID=1032243 RepID=A0AAW3ZV89_9BACT|nr:MULTISPECIES: FeoB-associated Cys-rich membrane protein [unclassified Campylobacter]MBE2984095.1 FeoB-associated Cys-rich membrane protein [Campylobacter sp. RM6883]MBE2986280.1 FeoB-associated Cys-rich membrane protein [Campylobacter sp. RM12919]MBE2988413.1 FeoB-associated Cys-rich membrane protein [Campylobacter sp. RM12920]MBE2995757.1 FeoB-associated Cys-rich membrane protein [Campylobacter sp. RM6913]MBE3029864.1 FeoB-associated Cys-rich membrane protein [Campylobacter sp. RM9344]
MAWYESVILITIAVAAGYYLYIKEFKKRDCGCGNGKNCQTKTKKYD